MRVTDIKDIRVRRSAIILLAPPCMLVALILSTTCATYLGLIGFCKSFDNYNKTKGFKYSVVAKGLIKSFKNKQDIK